MRPLKELPLRGRIMVDTAPIIYLLEDHPRHASRYAPVFERAEAGQYEIVVSTVTLAEVLTGPLRLGDEDLAERYRATLTHATGWSLVVLTPEIAQRAARIRARSRLKLPDAIQLATALETACIALVTHDRDFSGLGSASERLEAFG